MATLASFRAGIERVIVGAQNHRIAAMCAEADPLDCHRCLLVGRALAAEGMEVGHILQSGDVITHAEIEDRLLDLAGLSDGGLLLQSREECLAEAYRARAGKVAYAERRAPVSVSARDAKGRRD